MKASAALALVCFSLLQLPWRRDWQESMKPEEVKEFLSKTDLKTKADVLKRGEGSGMAGMARKYVIGPDRVSGRPREEGTTLKTRTGKTCFHQMRRAAKSKGI